MARHVTLHVVGEQSRIDRVSQNPNPLNADEMFQNSISSRDQRLLNSKTTTGARRTIEHHIATLLSDSAMLYVGDDIDAHYQPRTSHHRSIGSMTISNDDVATKRWEHTIEDIRKEIC